MDLQAIVHKVAITFPGFLVAIVLHEVAHGWMALKWGDRTAKLAGRLNLNLMAHADPVGTILIPIIGLATSIPIIGWAKPVPIDPRNFKKYRPALFWVSFAGPLMNVLLAILSALAFVCMVLLVPPESFYLRDQMIEMLRYSIMINLALFAFNLIPLPPLDGSRMVSALISYNANRRYEELGKYSFIILLILLMSGMLSYLFAPVFWLADLLVQLFSYLVIGLIS